MQEIMDFSLQFSTFLCNNHSSSNRIAELSIGKYINKFISLLINEYNHATIIEKGIIE